MRTFHSGKPILSAFILFFCLSTTVQSQTGTNKSGIFYSVTGNGLRDTSWIFGTNHMVKSSYLNEMPQVQKAFDHAKGVVVEVVIDSSKIMQTFARTMMKDTTLSSLFDKSFLDTLDRELVKTIGVGTQVFNQFKPINILVFLSLSYLENDSASPMKKYSGNPLDVHFSSEGQKAGKQVTALETMDEQTDLLFNSSSVVQQAEQLKTFIRTKDDMNQQSDELVIDWFNHDLDAMYQLSLKSLPVFGNEYELVEKRNTKWMQTLPALMKNQSQFIAVGALHLAGPAGLVNQLRKMGFTVTTIE